MIKKAYSVEMKKAGKSNKVIMETHGIKKLVRSRSGGDGIRMMNCTVSTNLWRNNILMVKG
ncbi:hypothetical protein [uncultured Streptococcus sp.]|uniref:hypothetical protein n=1 Tax=uncultured Streptococcus sp. TaxID=83427 RepID=UPI001A567A28|nr:hypothetical protein [uncultured Streptococcus sp.]VTY14280.1 Uncharacterised protein [uncultured Streptococcus sp.]